MDDYDKAFDALNEKIMFEHCDPSKSELSIGLEQKFYQRLHDVYSKTARI